MEAEAAGPAAETTGHPMDRCLLPLQQPQPDAAAQGVSSPPSQDWARQSKQLKPLYAGNELQEVHAQLGSPSSS